MEYVTTSGGTRCRRSSDPVDFCIAQDMMAFRLKSDIVYNKYLLAILRSREIQSFIMNNQVGTIIPHFKKGRFLF